MYGSEGAAKAESAFGPLDGPPGEEAGAAPDPGRPGPHMSPSARLLHRTAGGSKGHGPAATPGLKIPRTKQRPGVVVTEHQSHPGSQAGRNQTHKPGVFGPQCWTPSCFVTSETVPTFKKKSSDFLKKKDRQTERKEERSAAPSAVAACALQSPPSRKIRHESHVGCHLSPALCH